MTQEIDDTPAWIKKQQDKKAAEKRQVEEQQQRQFSASTVIHDKGSDFWQELVTQIALNAKALVKLEGEELAGYFSLNERGPEHHCHLQVNRHSVRFGPELSLMNLWYAPGSAHIRRYYQNQNIGDIELVANHEEVRAIYNGRPVTARELADATVQWMAERVRAKPTSPSYV
jgi:hypothetical protein